MHQSPHSFRSMSGVSGGVRNDPLRVARESDLSSVARIEMASFADPWSEHDFRGVLGYPQGIFLVSADRSTGVVTGYAIALCVVDEAEILNLAVDPVARRSGLGGRLLDAALAEAEGRGAAAVFLEVRESNAAARKLYASRGFAELSRRRRYYRNPVEDALVLRRAMQR